MNMTSRALTTNANETSNPPIILTDTVWTTTSTSSSSSSSTKSKSK